MDNPFQSIMTLAHGFQDTQMLYAMVKLNLADFLGQEPISAEKLAEKTATRSAYLARYLRALAFMGLIDERDGFFYGNRLTEFLRSDHPSHLCSVVLFQAGIGSYKAWGDLLYGLKTGKSPFRKNFKTDYFTWTHKHREEGAAFDHAMAFWLENAIPEILSAYSFKTWKTIMDVGGGNGTFLASVLQSAPDSRGILFDRPKVAAPGREILQSKGVLDRCEIKTGSFFQRIPAVDGAVILKNILHDWDDSSCFKILRSCRKAMSPESRLLVIEALNGPEAADFIPKLDMVMFVLNPGGRERTKQEFETLFKGAGFVLEKTVACGPMNVILEARPL